MDTVEGKTDQYAGGTRQGAGHEKGLKIDPVRVYSQKNGGAFVARHRAHLPARTAAEEVNDQRGHQGDRHDGHE